MVALAVFVVVAAETVPAAPQRTPAEDPVWSLYEDGFRAAAEGHDAEATAIFERVSREHPEHPAAKLAVEAARLLRARSTGRVPPRESAPPKAPAAPVAAPMDLADRLRSEPTTALARAELSIFQTIHGIAFGVEACLLGDCNDARVGILLAMLGGAGGLAGALLLTERGVTPGQALAVDSGTAWGAWNGVALVNSLSAKADKHVAIATVMAFQAAGLLGGAFLWDRLRVGAGDVSLANSGGIWAGVLTLLFISAGDFSLSDKQTFLALLVTTDAGVLGASLAATQFPMSRSRTLLMDAGGILGVLFGMGVDVLIEGDSRDHAAFFGSAMAGCVVGLAGALYVTRRWDAPDVPARVSLAPLPGGALATLEWRWR